MKVIIVGGGSPYSSFAVTLQPKVIRWSLLIEIKMNVFSWHVSSPLS